MIGFCSRLSGANTGNDTLVEVEQVELTDKAYRVNWGQNPAPMSAPALTIDAGAQQQGVGDTLDLAAYAHAAPTYATVTGKRMAFDGADILGDELVAANLTVKGFEVLEGTGRDDFVVGASQFKQIDLGAGNDVVMDLKGSVLPEQAGSVDPKRANWVLIDLGAGDDTVLGGIARGRRSMSAAAGTPSISRPTRSSMTSMPTTSSSTTATGSTAASRTPTPTAPMPTPRSATSSASG